jgi:stearoyl-CoA desaturase (delta-9 desaturase)
VNTPVIDIHYHRKMNWPTVITLALLHIGAVAALFIFNWSSFAVAVFLLWMAAGLGISMGYHRLHTHRSYEVPR